MNYTSSSPSSSPSYTIYQGDLHNEEWLLTIANNGWIIHTVSGRSVMTCVMTTDESEIMARELVENHNKQLMIEKLRYNPDPA